MENNLYPEQKATGLAHQKEMDFGHGVYSFDSKKQS